MASIIHLSSERPFASGMFRHCYRHPHNPGRCIKIVQSIEGSSRWYTVDPNEREFAEYRRHQSAGIPLERYFPQMHGFVETDLGRGLCVEFLQGTDGLPPISIEEWLTQRSPGLEADFVIQEFKKLAAFCVQHRILASCDELNNVGFIRVGSGHRLVVFDLKRRINREFIPISSFIPFFRRRKVARRFARSLAALEQAARSG